MKAKWIVIAIFIFAAIFLVPNLLVDIFGIFADLFKGVAESAKDVGGGTTPPE